MSEETLQKVMRCSTSSEVWTELHRLYDGAKEDRSYELCMRFFRLQKTEDHDMATHISTLKNIWYEMNKEIEGNDLPEMLLICKILDTLPDQYFNFKSSWLLMNKNDRNIENLTTQLCAHERALTSGNKEAVVEEALILRSKDKSKYKDKKRKCNYCGQLGHRVKTCQKWISDGRPPKPTPNKQSTSNVNMNLMTIVNNVNDIDHEGWYVDNGATSHVTNRGDLFKSFECFSTSHTVTTANGTAIQAVGKGALDIEADVRGTKEIITLNDVWYVPSIKKNLFSVLSAQDKLTNTIFESRTQECIMKYEGGRHLLIGVRAKNGGLYKLNVKNIKGSHEINHLEMSDQMQLYHERLGHQNKSHVKKVVETELGIKLKLDGELCEGCVFGKIHRHKFGTRERATQPGELIHTDVCGPFKNSYSKLRYYVLFKDDFTKYRQIYFLKEKGEVHEKLEQMLAETKVTGHIVKEILSDNGGEFDNTKVREILRKNGVRQRLTMPFTPEQNGCCERDNRTIVESARAMMYAHEEMPQGLWAELVNTATYILNRTGPTQEGKSPYELWFSKKPNIKHLRIIGSTCYAHIPKCNRKKMDKKAVKGILIGYDNDDGYRIWCKENSTLIRSRDVTFQERTFSPRNEIILQPPNLEPVASTSAAEHPSVTDNEDDADTDDHGLNVGDDFDRSIESERERETELESDEYLSAQEIEIERFRTLRNRSNLNPPSRYNDFAMTVGRDDEVNPEPKTFKEAMKGADKDKWIKAMNEELNSLKDNDTWEMVDLPLNRKAIPNKWIYKIKTNPDGSIERYKARLVIKGFSQKKGLDYYETFSPVAKTSTIRALLSTAANEKMTLGQFDVSTAFLYGTLDEEIFMKPPEGYESGSKVCKLKKSLYGLKQAPRCWNTCITDYIIQIGFEQSSADPCLFIRKRGDKKVVIALYVDDGLVAATDDDEVENLYTELRKRFKVTTKPASYFLGIEIKASADGSITIDQKAYARKILQRFGMANCKPAPTPIVKYPQTGKMTDCNEQFPYREAVGALSYLMVGTRPDIAFAVGVVSRTLQNPSNENVVGVKRIFRYIQGTLDYGITYSKGKRNEIVMYTDADHGGDPTTGRSTSGMVCLYSGGAISWRSNRQRTVALSSTEAEIVAASEAAREVLWLKKIVDDMATDVAKVELLIDNESALKLSKNPIENHHQTKHMHVKRRHFFLRECILNNNLVASKVTSTENLADMLTKPLYKPRLLYLSELMSLH